MHSRPRVERYEADTAGSPVYLRPFGPAVEEMALHWLASDDVPRLIVDAGLTIEWLNLSAEQELRRRHILWRRGDLLVATNAARQAELYSFLAQCGEDGSTLCLHGGGQDDHLLLTARTLTVGRFGLTFRRCGYEFRPAYPKIEAVFQLTRAETRVLLLLAEGHPAAEVARQLGVSTATTRSHIKSLYVKLNVKSREALLSRIRAYQM